MYIPGSFRPEANVEGNTDRLMNEKLKKSEQEIRLEELLIGFDTPDHHKSEYAHQTIENLLIEKNNRKTSLVYNLLNKHRLDYWRIKQNDQESYILMRRPSKGGKRYSLALVEHNNLGDFIDSLKDIESNKKFYNLWIVLAQAKSSKTKDHVGAAVIGMASVTMPTHLIISYGFESGTIQGTVASMLLGACVGMMYYSGYNYFRSKRKMKKLCKKLITDEKKALRIALK